MPYTPEWCAVHTQVKCDYHTILWWCVVHTKKSVRIETVLAHLIWCVNHTKLFTVQVWNKSRTRNSSVCKFKNASGSVQFGSIRCFCFCRGDPVAVLAVFTPKHNALEDVRNSSIPELNVYPCRSTPSLSK